MVFKFSSILSAGERPLLSLPVMVLVLLAVAYADKPDNQKITEKRGAIGSSSPGASSSAQQQAYATKLRQYQQAQALAQAEAQSSAEVRYVPQSKYTATPVAYTSGGASALQYQPQQQAVAYAQPTLKQSAVPTYSKAAYQVAQPAPAVPHYSLATDVSTFSYSSPIVRYSNLGLLSQISGKDAESSPAAYQSSGRVAYQAAPEQAHSKVQYVPQYETYPQQQQQQQYQRSAQPAQNYAVVSPKYSQASPQQKYIYVSAQDVGQAQAQASAAAPQQYVYQAVPQVQYEQQAYQPQYERQVQQLQAQAAHSIPQAVYSHIPQQYQQQYYTQAGPSGKHGIVYAN